MKKTFLFLLLSQGGLLSASPSALFVVRNETVQDFRLVFIRQDHERLISIDPPGSCRLQLVNNLPCGTYQIILFEGPPGDKNWEPLAECFVEGLSTKWRTLGYSCIWNNVLLTEAGLSLKIQYLGRDNWPVFDRWSAAYVYLVPLTSGTAFITPRSGQTTEVVARPKSYDVSSSQLNELFSGKVDDSQLHLRLLLKNEKDK